MQKAHLALIDALMSLAAKETVGRVKMAVEAEQMGVGAPWENALLFWVNRVRSHCYGNSDDFTASRYFSFHSQNRVVGLKNRFTVFNPALVKMLFAVIYNDIKHNITESYCAENLGFQKAG